MNVHDLIKTLTLLGELIQVWSASSDIPVFTGQRDHQQQSSC